MSGKGPRASGAGQRRRCAGYICRFVVQLVSPNWPRQLKQRRSAAVGTKSPRGHASWPDAKWRASFLSRPLLIDSVGRKWWRHRRRQLCSTRCENAAPLYSWSEKYKEKFPKTTTTKNPLKDILLAGLQNWQKQKQTWKVQIQTKVLHLILQRTHLMAK